MACTSVTSQEAKNWSWNWTHRSRRSLERLQEDGPWEGSCTCSLKDLCRPEVVTASVTFHLLRVTRGEPSHTSREVQRGRVNVRESERDRETVRTVVCVGVCTCRKSDAHTVLNNIQQFRAVMGFPDSNHASLPITWAVLGVARPSLLALPVIGGRADALRVVKRWKRRQEALWIWSGSLRGAV